MTEMRLRWADLKQGLTFATGQSHRIVIARAPVHRLEVGDEYFNAGSAVLLPDIPVDSTGGQAQAVDFVEDELWKQLLASHEDFAKLLWDHPFQPQAIGDAVVRQPGLGVVIVALRFLAENPGHRLLVAGHSDAAGDGSSNQRLSAARARTVLAVLEGDRQAFVEACRESQDGGDDSVILRYMANEHGWPCDPGTGGGPPREAMEEFQRTYNDRFSAAIAVDGTVGDETRGAYFDIYDEDLASMAGSRSELESLRAQLRFVSSETKVVACGDRYPIGNPARDAYRSRGNRRVELLFFQPPDAPDPADERTPQLIYERPLFRFEVLDPGALPRPTPSSRAPDDGAVAIVDASAPEPGVGDPEEPFETRMQSLGESDGSDPWAFLEPLDAARPAVGPQTFTVLEG